MDLLGSYGSDSSNSDSESSASSEKDGVVDDKEKGTATPSYAKIATTITTETATKGTAMTKKKMRKALATKATRGSKTRGTAMTKTMRKSLATKATRGSRTQGTAMTKTMRKSSAKDPDYNTVVKFFRILGETYEGGYLDESCQEMIQKYPQLLDCSCPFDEGIHLDGGMTAAECMCEKNDWCGRDTLVELVELGAKATANCYYSLFGYGSEFLPVLFYSGCLPLRNETLRDDFLLDSIFANDDWVDDNDDLHVCFKILVGNIEVGEQLSCGTINEAGVERIKKLPKLQVGWTHAKDGPFETFMKTNGYEKYLSTINGSSTNDKKTKKRKCEETQQQIKLLTPAEAIAINEKSEVDFKFVPSQFFNIAFRQPIDNTDAIYKLTDEMPGAECWQAAIKLTDGTIFSMDHPCMKGKTLFSYENYLEFQATKRNKKFISKTDARLLLFLNSFFYYNQEHTISWLNNLKKFRDCSQLRVRVFASRMSRRVHMLFKKHLCGYYVVSYNTKFEIMHECFLHKDQDVKHNVKFIAANGYAKEDEVGAIEKRELSFEEFRASEHDNQQETGTKFKQIVKPRMTGKSCTQYTEELSKKSSRSSCSSNTILLGSDDNAGDNSSNQSNGEIEIIKVAGGRSSRSKSAFNEELLKARAAEGTTKKKRNYCSIDDESDSEEEQDWKDPGEVRESDENNGSVFDKAVEEDEDDDWIVMDGEDEDGEAGSKENRKQALAKVKNIVKITRHQPAKDAAVTIATCDKFIMEVPDVVTSRGIDALSNEEKDDYDELQRIYLEKQTRTGRGAELSGDMRLRRIVRPARIEKRPDLKRKIEELKRRKFHGERYRLLELLRNCETHPFKFGGAVPTDLTPGRSFNDNKDVQEFVQLDNTNDENNMVTEAIDIDQEETADVDQLLVKTKETNKEEETKIETPGLSSGNSENIKPLIQRKVLVKEEPCDDDHNNNNNIVVHREKE